MSKESVVTATQPTSPRRAAGVRAIAGEAVGDRAGGGPPPPWAGRSSPRCRSRRRGCSGDRGRRGSRRALRREASPSSVDERGPGPLRRSRPRRSAASVRSTPGAARPRACSASRSRGIGGVERHVGPAGLEHGEQPDDHVDRALRRRAHQGLRPHSEPPQVRGPAGWPARVELAVGQRRRPRRTTAAPPGSAPPGLEQLVERRVAGSPRRCRSTRRPAAARSASVRSGSAESRAPRVRPPRLEQG